MAILSPLAIAALALLSERAMHPYEMYGLLIDRQEDRLLKVRPGTLYHTVDRLAGESLVRPVRTERAGNRPERTTYEITDAGQARLAACLEAMLATPAEEYPEFPLAISEAHNLPRERVLELLRLRLAALDTDLETLRAAVAGIDSDLPRRFWIETSYVRTMRTQERDWVAALIDDIDAGRLPWSADEDPPATGTTNPRETTEPTPRQTGTRR